MKILLVLAILLISCKLAANDAYNACGETLEEHVNNKGEYCMNPTEESCNGLPAASNYNASEQRFEVTCIGTTVKKFHEQYERVGE